MTFGWIFEAMRGQPDTYATDRLHLLYYDGKLFFGLDLFASNVLVQFPAQLNDMVGLLREFYRW